MRGVIHVNSTTDYVLRYTPSKVGGHCADQNALVVRAPGATGEGKPSILCWQEVDGFIVTSTQHAASTNRFPAEMAQPEPAAATPEARRSLPPFN